MEKNDRWESLVVAKAEGSLPEGFDRGVDAPGGGVGAPRSKHPPRLDIQLNPRDRPRLSNSRVMLAAMGIIRSSHPFTRLWRWFGGEVYHALLPTEIPEGPNS